MFPAGADLYRKIAKGQRREDPAARLNQALRQGKFGSISLAKVRRVASHMRKRMQAPRLELDERRAGTRSILLGQRRFRFREREVTKLRHGFGDVHHAGDCQEHRSSRGPGPTKALAGPGFSRLGVNADAFENRARSLRVFVRCQAICVETLLGAQRDAFRYKIALVEVAVRR